MARPRKTGLDYFSHDCDASDDQCLRRVRKHYGETGIAYYWRLLEMVYARGRALELGPDDAMDLIADELRTPYVSSTVQSYEDLRPDTSCSRMRATSRARMRWRGMNGVYIRE
jgi:hypothetical protein